MRLIQHKKEAYWFYRFLSVVYDRYVNPLFWTPAMRDEALDLARLDDSALEVVDVGAGTGFTTEGIVERVPGRHVTMLDQSPHQLAQAARKPSLAACTKVQGDAEALPFATDRFDRYVSAGSVEYWPDPQRAVVEAYRVLKPGGIAVVIGPLPPPHPVLRRLSSVWMLFPPAEAYRRWFRDAGFGDVAERHVAPSWFRGRRGPYAIAISGVKPAAGDSPLRLTSRAPSERLDEAMTPLRRLRFAARFVAGSAAGAAFVPIAGALALAARLRSRRTP